MNSYYMQCSNGVCCTDAHIMLTNGISENNTSLPPNPLSSERISKK